MRVTCQAVGSSSWARAIEGSATSNSPAASTRASRALVTSASPLSRPASIDSRRVIGVRPIIRPRLFASLAMAAPLGLSITTPFLSIRVGRIQFFTDSSAVTAPRQSASRPPCATGASLVPESGQLLDPPRLVPFVHDVVAVEHGACLVARDRHRDLLGDPGLHEIPRRRAPEIMRDRPSAGLPRLRVRPLPVDPGCADRFPPLSIEPLLENRPTLIVEDSANDLTCLALDRARLLALRAQKHGEFGERAKRKTSPRVVLGGPGFEADDFTTQIDLAPFESGPLRPPPSRFPQESW